MKIKERQAMTRKSGVLRIVTAFMVLTIAGPVYAQQKDRDFRDWTVYTTTLQGAKTCYAASFPISKKGNYTKRDEPYFIVTRIRKGTYEVSKYIGYTLRSGSDVNLDIEGSKYTMFTKGERAWAPSEKLDADIVAKMKSKSRMSVRGISTKGTHSTDTYSLMGFTAAINRMDELCR